MGYPLEFRNNVVRSILSDGTRISVAAEESAGPTALRRRRTATVHSQRRAGGPLCIQTGTRIRT